MNNLILRRNILILLGLLMSLVNYAQDQISIADGGVVLACSGAFLDSGLQAGDYMPNENYTITICPEVEGDVIYVEFLSADIVCPDPDNNCDWLQVFDGDSNGANSMGYVTGPITFTASPLNTTGCLTFQFVSNGTGEGAGFSGTVSCETPCERPYAIASTDPDEDFPIKLCVGEEITFDGSASTVADGQVIDQWLWDFRDGTTADTPVATHSYDTPGEYIVQLYLVDDNDCASTNRTDIQVWVSTYPNFEFEFPQGFETCLGDTLCLITDVSALPVTWDAEPTVDLGGGIAVPDIVGECFDSTVEFNGFSPGQTLASIDDLENIYLNFEHSFMGDLLIQIICPDGTTVNLHEQGGGGTNLGEANQADDEVPGVGWDYYWSNDAVLGTWEEESGTNTMASGTGTSLIPDTYSSVGNLEDLVGCPLNGIWSLSICDLWGADDGTVFEWGINFNPDIYPELTQFTPSYGSIENDSDSTYWSGPFIEFADPGTDHICVVPDVTGPQEYIYTANNDFGCSFDTAIVVNIYQAMIADAGEDWTFCGDENLLDGGVQDFGGGSCNDDSGTYDYCYENNENITFTYCPDDPGAVMMSIEFLSGAVEGFFDEVTVYDGDDTGDPMIAQIDGDMTGQVFVASGGTGCITFTITSDGSVSCSSGAFNELVWEVGCAGGGSYDYYWTPTDNVSDPNDPNAEVLQITDDGIFTLEAYPTGHPACATTDEVFVSTAYEFDWMVQDPSCLGNDGFIEVDIDEATGDGPWDVELYESLALQDNVTTNGEVVSFTDLIAGDYQIRIIGANCEYEIDVPIEAAEPLFFEISSDTTICIDGTATLEAWATDQDPDGSWDYVWDNGIGNGSTVYASPVLTTTYSVYAIDDFDCESAPLTVDVNVLDSLQVTLVDDTLVCGGGTANLEALNMSGGIGPYDYSWSFNGVSVGNGEQTFFDPFESGQVCVNVTDQCESPMESDCFDLGVEPEVIVEIAATVQEECPTLYTEFSIPVDSSLYVSTLWTLGDGSTEYNETVFEHEYTEPGLYDVSLQLTSEIGCVYYKEFPSYIQVYTPPTAAFYATPQPTRIPDTEISFVNQSIGDIVYYEFVFDTTSYMGISTEMNPIFEFPYDQAGDYAVSLFVVDSRGCTDKHTEFVYIDDLLNLYVPNAFTPNGDGVNDVFYVAGTDIDPDKFSLEVFNRWGETVYETNDLYGTWAGDMQGGEYYYAMDQVYSWRIIIYSLTNQERKEITGSVTILR